MSLNQSQPTVCFIVGLAGSGKTHKAEEMMWDRHFDENFYDDIQQQEDLIDCLRQGKKCTVCELQLLTQGYRDYIVDWINKQVPSVAFQWICFENDLTTANWNCLHRTNKSDAEGHIHLNQMNYKSYTYEQEASIIPIHRITSKEV